jgi:hemin uptake protein HemP
MTMKTVEQPEEVLAPAGQQGGPGGRSGVPRRTTTTRELLAGGNELQIEHNGEIYTLRQTSKGKLILTK